MNLLRAFSSKRASDRSDTSTTPVIPVPFYANYEALVAKSFLPHRAENINNDQLIGVAWNGLLHGHVVYLQQATTANYHYGLKHGPYTSEHKVGQYCFGVRDKAFTITCGDLRVSVNYDKGELHGPLEISRQEGKTVSNILSATFEHGKLDGESNWILPCGKSIKATFTATGSRSRLDKFQMYQGGRVVQELIRLDKQSQGGGVSKFSSLSKCRRMEAQYSWFNRADVHVSEFRTALPSFTDLPPALEATIYQRPGHFFVMDGELRFRSAHNLVDLGDKDDTPANPHAGQIGYRIEFQPDMTVERVMYHFPRSTSTNKPVRTLDYIHPC